MENKTICLCIIGDNDLHNYLHFFKILRRVLLESSFIVSSLHITDYLYLTRPETRLKEIEKLFLSKYKYEITNYKSNSPPVIGSLTYRFSQEQHAAEIAAFDTGPLGMDEWVNIYFDKNDRIIGFYIYSSGINIFDVEAFKKTLKKAEKRRGVSITASAQDDEVLKLLKMDEKSMFPEHMNKNAIRLYRLVFLCKIDKLSTLSFVKPLSEEADELAKVMRENSVSVNNTHWAAELFPIRGKSVDDYFYQFIGSEDFADMKSVEPNMVSCDIYTVYILSKQYMIDRKYLKHSVVLLCRPAASNSKAIRNAIASLPDPEHRIWVSYWQDGTTSHDICVLVNLDEKHIIGEFTMPSRKEDYTEWFAFGQMPKVGMYIRMPRQPAGTLKENNTTVP